MVVVIRVRSPPRREDLLFEGFTLGCFDYGEVPPMAIERGRRARSRNSFASRPTAKVAKA